MIGLNTEAVIISGKYYLVKDFPREEIKTRGFDILRKNVAYRIKTDMTKGLFPYRGVIGFKEKFNPYKEAPGIYIKMLNRDGSEWAVKLAYPHTKLEKQLYQLDNERNVAAAIKNGDFRPDQFREINMNPATGGKSFKPPIRAQDDALNTLMKLAIRLKDAPFEPYGKRLEALAVVRSSIEGTNIKNNTKRGFLFNNAMSPSKFVTNADVWQLEAALILRDVPGAIHPMFPDGRMLVMFPCGPAFEILPDKLINIQDMVTDAIRETNALDKAAEEQDDADEKKDKEKDEDDE